jgi:hypothetical protein
MVEFVLVIVFVFLVFVSAIQMIFLMYAYNTLADAAKEGVRYAIVHGTENSQCSGPGKPTASPAITCADAPGANVVSTSTNFAALSFQNILSTDVAVSYNPADQNGTCANGACASPGCSAPGCMVRVTVGHTYTPLFGLSWPNFRLNAAAEGRIIN